MRTTLFLTILSSLALVGCGGTTDRDENIPPWNGGGGEGGEDGADPGDDGGDPGDDGADPGDDGGASPDVGDGADPGDDGGTDEPPPDDTGGGDTDDPGDDGGVDPAADDPPDCHPYWALWPTDASAEPPATRDEFWCYVNRKRMSYVEHNRSNGPLDEEGDGSVTWPYMMDWDKDLVDSAQAEAERVANGGSPSGSMVGGGPYGAKNLWIKGNNTADYMLTTVDDVVSDWWDPTPCCHDPGTHSGISVGNGAARMGLYYHDSSGAGPVLTKMGTGMAQTAGGARVLVVRLAP